MDDIQILEGHVLPTEMTKRKFEIVMQLTKPNKVFEIGFNAGHSARIFLEFLGEGSLHSIDLCLHPYTKQLANELMQEDERFSFERMNSFDLSEEDLQGYDLVFVDGCHSMQGVSSDLEICSIANTKYILVDDYDTIKHPQIIDGCSDFVERTNYYWFGESIVYDASAGKNHMRLLVREDIIPTFPENLHPLFTKK